MRHFAVSLVHEIIIYGDRNVVGCSTGAISNYYLDINNALSIQCKQRYFYCFHMVYGIHKNLLKAHRFTCDGIWS